MNTPYFALHDHYILCESSTIFLIAFIKIEFSTIDYYFFNTIRHILRYSLNFSNDKSSRSKCQKLYSLSPNSHFCDSNNRSISSNVAIHTKILIIKNPSIYLHPHNNFKTVSLRKDSNLAISTPILVEIYCFYSVSATPVSLVVQPENPMFAFHSRAALRTYSSCTNTGCVDASLFSNRSVVVSAMMMVLCRRRQWILLSYIYMYFNSRDYRRASVNKYALKYRIVIIKGWNVWLIKFLYGNAF